MKAMKTILNYWNLANAKADKSLFRFFALLKERVFFKRKLKILFSKHPGLEQEISKGFRFSRHNITFEEISSADITDFDLVVPLYLRDLKYLNGVRHLIRDNPIPIPSVENITLFDDKFLFNQAVLVKGFAPFIPRMGGALAYPYILKKRVDNSSNSVHIISNSDEEQLLKDVISSPEYFCQEMIRGSSEYATHILIKDRKIKHSINIEYIFDTDFPVKMKDKEMYRKISHCPHLDTFASILTALDFEGLCCVNYKEVDKQPFIFEINPRFGGSLCPYFFTFI
jgi:hypothetical protein